VLAANSIISEDSIDRITLGNPQLRALVGPGGGAAAVYAPDGYRMTAPLDEFTDGFAVADIDLALIEGSKVFADPAGHYFRPDIARHVLDGWAGPAAANPPDFEPAIRALRSEAAE